MKHAKYRWTRSSVTLVAMLVTAGQASAQRSEVHKGTVDTLVALVAGESTTCVTTANGAGLCWGRHDEHPGQVRKLFGADGRPARLRSASPGWLTMCAQSMDGQALCDPSLGGVRPTPPARSTSPAHCDYSHCVYPVARGADMPTGELRAVDAGWMHACALGLDGSAYCWGRNDQGQLGNGQWAPDSTGSVGEFVSIPTAVATEYRFRMLSAGENTTCGVTEPGAAIFCWGYGQSGQTGDTAAMHGCSGVKPFNDKPCSNAVPARVGVEPERGSSSVVRFAQVSVGTRLACAVSVSGNGYCWGSNYRCALGRCRESDSPLAHLIPLAGRVAEIGAGYWHACARTVDHRVFCWGQNTEGQLGSLVSANAGADGLPPNYRDTTDREVQNDAYRNDPCFLGGRCSPAPVEVSPGRRWSALAVGSNHACALDDADGNVYCWGGSDTGAVGLGARLVMCVNRSTQWKDVPCNASPVRVPGLPRLVARAVPVTPRRSASTRPSLAARVTVSRREVRVVFPREGATTWGWSALKDPEYSPWYDWGISNDGMDGPLSLRLIVGRSADSARTFSSLESLVAAGRASLCSPGMSGHCADKEVTASAENGQVVLVLRDSAVIARMFGLRPAKVGIWAARPNEERRYPMDTAAVDYIEPLIPIPDGAARADAKASQRRYEARISSVRRFIELGGDSYSAQWWLAVGDTARVSVHELSCHYDACMGEVLTIADTLWRLDDTVVAGLHSNAKSEDLEILGSSIRIVGRQPGRSTIRIALPPLASDTAPSSTPPERVLSREVTVTQRITRIEMYPRIDSVRVNEVFELRVRAGDVLGQWHDNPPARVTVGEGDRQYITTVTSPIRVLFDTPGVHRVVAQFGMRSDTLSVRVVPAP